MAVPKRRTSRTRRDTRRATHAASSPAKSICSQCHEPKLPHRVCPTCGYYDGKEIIETE